MPLNQPKTYAFKPKSIEPIKLVSRSSRRSRLWIGGTFFRSHERGEAANLIKITAVEDLSGLNPEGMLIVQHTVLNADESIFVSNMSMPQVNLYELSLNWDQEIRITKVDGRLVARKYGIRWQIAGGEMMLADLGQVIPGRLKVGGGVAFKVDLMPDAWPTNGILYLRPRTHRYTLVVTSVTDQDTMTSTTGWDIVALRATLNESDTWIRMPERAVTPSPPLGNEDAMDDQTDELFLTAFNTTNMTGGDGLPATPVGLNTGPDRVLVHLNYAEKDDGSMGELNQVFEWVGDTTTSGSWQRYS